MTLKIGHFQVLKIRLSKRGQVQNLSCKNEFCLHENKKRFPINDSTLSLPLKQRLMANRKWSIKRKKNASSCDMGEGVRQVQVSTVAAI